MKVIDAIDVTDTGSFTRASTATYFDKAGVLQTAAIDEPRWSYDPADLTSPPTLLLEDAATNLFLYSGDLNNAYWQKSQVTVSANSALGPDGLMSMEALLSNNSGATDHQLNPTYNYTAGLVYKCAVYARLRDSGVHVFIKMGSAAFGAIQTVMFNLSTGIGTLVSGSPSYAVEDLGGGLLRLWISATATATANAAACIGIATTNATTSPVPAGTGAYVGVAQMETGSGAPTSYIPTTSVTVTRAADFMGGMMVCNIPETDYPEWNNLTAYALDARVMVTSAAYHNIYQSVVAANTGNDPTLENDPWENPVKWQLVSKTNRWKPFDNYISSQASIADRMYYSIQIPSGKMFDSISLRNLDADGVRLAVIHPTEGLVYSSTLNLISDSGITDYWEYFFTPIERALTVTLTGIPVYDGVRIDICVIKDGSTVQMGAVVNGLSYEVGDTQLGIGIGSTDFSVKTITEFGLVRLKERSYSDEMSLVAVVPNTSLAYVKNLLNRLRGKANVYIASDALDSDSGTVHGWHDDWNLVVQYQMESVISTNIKGLT